MQKVYIILLNWNNWKDTIQCLESLYRLTYPSFHVIVMDNDSKDQSITKIQMWAEGSLNSYSCDLQPVFIDYVRPPIQKPIQYNYYQGPEPQKSLKLLNSLSLIQTGKNLGYAGGNNVGIKYALSQEDCEHIWILNNDTVVHPEALQAMVDLMQKKNTIGMVGSKLLCFNNPQQIQSIGSTFYPWLGKTKHAGNQGLHSNSFEEDQAVDLLVGASMLIRRAVLERVGLIEERYFLYREEADYCLKVLQKRWYNYYCANSIVWHKESASVGMKSLQQDYYLVRNMLFLVQHFYPYYIPFAMVGLAWQTILPKIVKMDWKRLRVVLQGYFDFLIQKDGPWK